MPNKDLSNVNEREITESVKSVASKRNLTNLRKTINLLVSPHDICSDLTFFFFNLLTLY